MKHLINKVSKLSFLVLITLLLLSSLKIDNSTIMINDNQNNELLIESRTQQFNQEFEMTAGLTIDNNDPAKNWSEMEANYDWINGSGTFADPYIIHDVAFKSNGLIIRDSKVYFMINNSAFQTEDNDKSGLKLINVENGTIIKCQFNENGIGLFMENCKNLTIYSNHFIQNLIGIKISTSVSDLTIYQNFLYLNIYDDVILKSFTNIDFDNGTYGNYWSRWQKSIENPLTNFTYVWKHGSDEKNSTFFFTDIALNLSLSPLVQDQHPLVANDTDGDDLDDFTEVFWYETNKTNSDTDGDLMGDGWEVKNGFDPKDSSDAKEDADDDDLDNYVEFLAKYENENDVEERTDPNDADSDNDGWEDGKEVDEETSPTNPFDHPDNPPAANFQISYGFSYLFFIAMGIFSVILYLKKKHKLA